MKYGVLLALLLVTIVFFPGCQTAPDSSTASPESTQVSSIPWNKPASWEGTGALGGFMQQGGH